MLITVKYSIRDFLRSKNRQVNALVFRIYLSIKYRINKDIIFTVINPSIIREILICFKISSNKNFKRIFFFKFQFVFIRKIMCALPTDMLGLFHVDKFIDYDFKQNVYYLFNKAKKSLPKRKFYVNSGTLFKGRCIFHTFLKSK